MLCVRLKTIVAYAQILSMLAIICLTLFSGQDTVLFLHPFCSSSKVLSRPNPVYGKLVAAGFRVVAMDLRGHGLSTKSHDINTMA